MTRLVPIFETLSSGAIRVRLEDSTGRALTQSQYYESLSSDASFCDWLMDALLASSLDAFFWEHPAVLRSTLQSPAEFALTPSAALARVVADPSPFAEKFRSAGASEVATFPNLGGDAVLVVPTPLADPVAYPHLAAFLREAPASQRRSVLQAAGVQVLEHLGDVPRWLSTAGLGVSWLHLRLDSRPKYYRHRGYVPAP